MLLDSSKQNSKMIAPKRMASGKYIDLGSFTIDDVDIQDITTSLNTLYRFNGHYKDKKPLTVAQHTHLCMILSERFFPEEDDVLFACLLHDFGEAYYGDVATPLKKLMGQVYRDFTKTIDDPLYEKLWIIDSPLTEEVEQKVKVCDLMALDIERRAMWTSQFGKKYWPVEPVKINLQEKLDLFDQVQKQEYITLDEMYETFKPIKETIQYG